MNRTKLFTQAFFVMFRRGAGVMWLAALAVAALEILLSEALSLDGWAGSLVGLVRGVVTGAFLTGVLITAVNSQAEGQPAGIGAGMRAGVRPFVPLLLVGLVLALPGWIAGLIMAAVSAPLLKFDPSTLNPSDLTSLTSGASVLLCCLAPLVLLVYLAVSLLLYAVGIGAERGVALEGLGLGAGLRRGWGLLRSRFPDILALGLIMLAGSLAVFILFGCPAVFFLVIANGAFKSPDAAAAAASSPLAGWIEVFFSLVFVPVGIYFSTVWTLAFRRWQGKEDAIPVPPVQPPVELPPIGG